MQERLFFFRRVLFSVYSTVVLYSRVVIEYITWYGTTVLYGMDLQYSTEVYSRTEVGKSEIVI